MFGRVICSNACIIQFNGLLRSINTFCDDQGALGVIAHQEICLFCLLLIACQFILILFNSMRFKGKFIIERLGIDLSSAVLLLSLHESAVNLNGRIKKITYKIWHLLVKPFGGQLWAIEDD